MRTRTTTAALVLAATALTGCGIDDDRERDDEGTADGSPGASTTRPAGGQPSGPTLVELQEALVAADTGRGSSMTSIAPITLKRTSSYRIGDEAARTAAELAVPGLGTIGFESITGADDDMFLQFEVDETLRMDKCWASLDADAVEDLADGQVPFDAAPGLPSEVAALLDAQDDGTDTTVSLAVAAAAFGAATAAELGIDTDSTARVPITLTTGDRTVTLSWPMSDVLDVAEADGLDVEALDADTLDAAEVSTFEGTISKPGSKVDVAAPPEDRRVPFSTDADDAELDAAFAACEAR